MSNAFGVVSFGGNNVNVEGLQEYRAVGSISFLGRYRLIDFPLSNMTNSGIDNIQLFVNKDPRSIVGHVGTGRHYNINSKRGKLHMLFSSRIGTHDLYNTDIASYAENQLCCNTPFYVYIFRYFHRNFFFLSSSRENRCLAT